MDSVRTNIGRIPEEVRAVAGDARERVRAVCRRADRPARLDGGEPVLTYVNVVCLCDLSSLPARTRHAYILHSLQQLSRAAANLDVRLAAGRQPKSAAQNCTEHTEKFAKLCGLKDATSDEARELVICGTFGNPGVLPLLFCDTLFGGTRLSGWHPLGQALVSHPSLEREALFRGDLSLSRVCQRLSQTLSRERFHSIYRVGQRELISRLEVSRREWTLFSLVTEF